MNKPEFESCDRLTHEDYHILFFEIQQHYLIEALTIATNKDEEYVIGFFGDLALEIINSRSNKHNIECVEKLKNLFAEKIMPEIDE